MPLTAAERSKRYPKRQKLINRDLFLQKEAARVARYFVKAGDWSPRKAAKRRKKSAECMQRLRASRRTAPPDPCCSSPKRCRSVQSDVNSDDEGDLVTMDEAGEDLAIKPKVGVMARIQLKAPTKRKATHKRISRAVSKLKCKLLKKEVADIRKRAWRAEKKLVCSADKITAKKARVFPTPVKMAISTMQEDGISPSKAPVVRKALVLTNTLLVEVSSLPATE